MTRYIANPHSPLAGYDRSEKGLLLGASIFSAAVTYLILTDFTLIPGDLSAKGDPVAEIIQTKNVVKRRPASVPLWSAANDNQALYQKDQVFTDSKSSVKIAFNGSEEIEIEQNALVIIEKPDNSSAGIEVKQGSVIAKTSENGKSLKVRLSADDQANISGLGATTLISSDGSGNPKISFLSGKGRIEINGKSTNLNSDQELIYDPKTKSIRLNNLPKIEIQSPSMQSPSILAPGAISQFKWKGLQAYRDYRFQLANDDRFLSLLDDHQTTDTQRSFALSKNGNYYWRVGVRDQKTGLWTFTNPTKFSTVLAEPPYLKWPLANQTFDLRKLKNQQNGIAISFDWEKVDGASGYEVEVSLTSDFSEKILSKSNDRPPLHTRNFAKGNYFWRVRSVFSDQLRSIWSESETFTISDGTTNFANEIELVGASLDSNFENSSMAMFSWRPVSGATNYQFRIARNMAFQENDIVSSKQTAETKVTWKAISPGIYHWQIATTLPNGKVIYSQKMPFEIKPNKLKTLQPSDGEVLEVDPAKKLVKLRWHSVLGAERYQVEISEDPAFENKIFDTTLDKNQLQWSVPKSGKYYWRIKPILINKLRYYPVAFSTTKDFTVKFGNKIDGPLWISPNKQSILTATEQGSDISLQWRTVTGTTNYEVELFQLKNKTEETIYRKITQQPTITRSLTPGKYQARIRFKNENGVVSNWSYSDKFRIRGLLSAPILNASATELIRIRQNPSVDFFWERNQNSKSYKFQISADESFTKSNDRILKQNRYSSTLPVGEFFARVASIDTTGTQGVWSRPVRIAVLTPSVLGAAKLIQPQADQKVLFRKIEPDVAFKWSPVEEAKSYQLVIAKDRYFKTPLIKKELEKNSTIQSLTKGTYYWKVLALNKKTRQQTASDIATFTIKQDTSMPEPVIPPDNSEINFDEDQPRVMKFMWTKPADVSSVNIIVAKDPEFSSLVGRVKAAEKNDMELMVKNDGAYYWFVEGRDSRENVALRSPVQRFEVGTTEVSPPKTTRETYRLEFGYSPSTLDYSHSTEDGLDNTFVADFTQSYNFALRGWLTENFGTDIEIARKTQNVDVTIYENSSDTQSLALNVLDASGVMRYRVSLFEKSYPIDAALRFGYSFNQVVSFVNTDILVSRSSNIHSLITGVETTIPLGGSFSTEIKFDYLHLVTSFPIETSSQTQYVGSANLVYQFLRHGILGYGIFYRTQKYTYKDSEYNTNGELDMSTSGMVYSLGWAL